MLQYVKLQESYHRHMEHTDRLLTVKEFREKCGISLARNSVNRWIRTGKIPATRIGDRWFINESVVDAVLRGEVTNV